ncbi:hypothetical protein GCM10010353_21440 [Streptomyces chryseus]|uniref:Uncharacterized protein n=1 Tax=Streptomyces chryseus TaxID=68186 RepID=A0ABQ3DTG1_9ACTN|nr:hypothetical protein GCM10010353_21440 [Streptomyces chryseus]GHB12502.1 hypothetical protein GCM10010346_40060 [Streptomyces chryseus]
MEASIVTVRRGMERQYGTGLSVHRWGRSVRDHGARTYGRVGFTLRQTTPEPEWDFSIASRNRA